VKLALGLCLAATLASAAPSSRPSGKFVRVATPNVEAMPSRGPKQALVTIELFFRPFLDSRGPTFKAIEHLQAEHPTRVRILYRVVKVTSSSRLHYAALEAWAEGKFHEFLTELDNQQSASLTDAQLVQIAHAAGLDDQQLAEVLKNAPPEFDHMLDENDRRSRQRFHNHQNGVLINGQFLASSDINKPAELERAYEDARERALDLLDRGVDASDLADAFETGAAANPMLAQIQVNQPDDVVGELPSSPVLASPPLDFRGMPSLGAGDARTLIAVLCIPSTSASGCRSVLRAAAKVQEVYADRVRVVWAPFFSLTREDAAELGILADAALCAERVGASVNDFGSPSSPGWDWLQATIEEISRAHRRVTAERVLAAVAPLLHVDEAAFAACRAHQAGSAIRWVEAAIRAGVRASPSTVVGGRIYGPITDSNTLQQLVAAELEPSGTCDGCLRLDSIVPAWRSGNRP
jgi:2-hydroxychromene-2-carboxylate isomerase